MRTTLPHTICIQPCCQIPTCPASRYPGLARTHSAGVQLGRSKRPFSRLEERTSKPSGCVLCLQHLTSQIPPASRFLKPSDRPTSFSTLFGYLPSLLIPLSSSHLPTSSTSHVQAGHTLPRPACSPRLPSHNNTDFVGVVTFSNPDTFAFFCRRLCRFFDDTKSNSALFASAKPTLALFSAVGPHSHIQGR